jgi:cyclophilin family peptidyl-prolyl cis-trans isomerase
MSRFSWAFAGNNARTRAKRRSSRSRVGERKSGPLGMRRLCVESLESRQLLSITLPVINDVELPAGTAVFVPLKGSSDVAGKTVHYDVTLADLTKYASITPVVMPQTNKSLTFNIAINGTTEPLTFQLLDNLAPTTTSKIEGYVQAGFYDGLSIYRNGQDNNGNPFVIQGGNDPPTGAIKTDKSPMDEEFHPDLRFTSTGLLAMARGPAPGSSSTEFFDTEQLARHLDYNYTIFGVQTGGTSTVEAIAAMPNQDASQDPEGIGYLETPLTITSASIFTDTQNGVLQLKAPTGVTGTFTINVTASDGTSAPQTQSFTVTVAADDASNPANPWAAKTPTTPTTVTYLPPSGGSITFTSLDNSTTANALQFKVEGVTAGNDVQILANGNVIGHATATGTTVFVTTDGATPLTPGANEFTAIQIAKSQTVSVTESGGEAMSKTADVPSLNSLFVAQVEVGIPTTIALASDQAATTNKPTAKFVVTFDNPVTDFDTTTVNYATNLTGSTAFSDSSKAQIAITPTGTASAYTVTVTGADKDGAIIFSCPAQTYHDASDTGNSKSTGTNTVTYDSTKPTPTIALATGQSAATSQPTAAFQVDFGASVTDFSTATVNYTTNLAASTAFSSPSKAQIAITPTGTATVFTVTVTGMDQDGNIVFTCPADTYHGLTGKGNSVSTGTNQVAYDTTKPSVTVALTSDQTASTTTPTARFLVTFSEPVTDFTNATVNFATNLASSTAFSSSSKATIDVSPKTAASVYTITVTGLDQKGDVVFTCPADKYHDAAGNVNTVVTGNATVVYAPPRTLAVSLVLTTISEGDGKHATTGTVTASVAPSTDLDVYLTSTNTSQAVVNGDLTENTVTSKVTIAKGTTSAQFVIDAVDDQIAETSANTVNIIASAPGSAYTSGQASLSVLNIDVAKTLTVHLNPSTFAENAGNKAATGTVTVSVPPTSDLVVNLTSSSTSQATVDSSVIIPAGQTSSAPFFINAVDDGVAESAASTVTITASAPPASGYTSGKATLSVLNIDVAKLLTVQLSSSTILENAGAKATTGTVTASTPPASDLVVTLTSSNTKQATVPTSVIIPAGQLSSSPFSIDAVDDGIAETSASSVTITASAPQVSGYTFGTAVLTVTNTDVAPTVSINDVTADKNSGKNGFTFTVTLSAPVGQAVSVIYTTRDGTATSSGPNPDYKAKSGTLTIPIGETSGRFSQIVVPVYGNSTPGPDKTFFVELTDISGATIADGEGKGTILGGASTAAPGDTVGLFASTGSTFFLHNTNSSGYADTMPNYGPASAGWIPVVGDWDGNGTDTLGLYNPATSTFYLKNTNSTGMADVTFVYGPANSGWTPIAGDWNGDGTDTIGLYDPATSVFYLRNTNNTGYADLNLVFGPAHSGWQPIAGDWDGNTTTTIGLYNPATSTFYLRNTNNSGYADVTFIYGAGNSGRKAIAGDWDGNGTSTIGLYDPTASVFHLRNSNSAGSDDAAFTYGPANGGWTPIVGDWNGAAALRAADGAVVAAPDTAPLVQSELQPLVTEAIAQWAAAGLPASAVDALKNVRVAIADLAGANLGLTQQDTIYIDQDAAGHGWFVDPTPQQDEEFVAGGSSQQHGQPAVDSRALDRIDLLTAVEHELGHVLGLADVNSTVDDLMSGTLSTGLRRKVAVADVDAVFAVHGSQTW